MDHIVIPAVIPFTPKENARSDIKNTAADPTQDGSPFKNGNFSKFALGIALAAVVLIVIIAILFLTFSKKHGLSTSTPLAHHSELLVMQQAERS